MEHTELRGHHEHIGYVECVDLPAFGIVGLRAKVDTGARTSALHVDAIEPLPGGRVRFDVVLNRKTEHRVHVVTRVQRVGHVRSSTGVSEERYFVSTALRLGAVSKQIEISLAARHGMQFRMLLGRSAVAHDFLIDAGRRYVLGRRPTRRLTRRKGSPRSKGFSPANDRTKTNEP